MTVQPTRDQLRALANAATPGPWENTWNGVQQSFDAATKVGEYAWEGVGIVPEEYVREHDAEFIAAARTAVPQLLDQLDEAEEEARHWRAAFDSSNSERNMHRDDSVRHRLANERAEARIKAVQDVLDTRTAAGQDTVRADLIRRALDG